MKDLFPEFKPATGAQWKERITRDLKGEPFENLVWKNENGFDIMPFYTAEDLKSKVDPAFYHCNWEVCATSLEKSSSGINRDLLYQLEKGATGVLVGPGRHNYENLLRDIRLDIISSTFFCTEENLEALTKYIGKHYKDAELRINLFPATLTSRKEMESWIAKSAGLRTATSRTTSVDALGWFGLGALPYYELGLAFCLLAEIMDAEEKGNITGNNVPVIRLGLDSDLFVQIAKLRATRRLWEIIKPEFKRSGELYIIAETSLANKSVSDPYNNLLRSSVEAFAAIAGGCNELVVHNFDALSGKTNKTGTRLALNQQHLLKEESYLDKMGDVGCGSYYIETLTDNLAKRALDTFKDIMKAGGYFSALGNGTMQKEIETQYRRKEEKITSGEQVVVGVNKFRNEKEQPDYSGVEETLRERSIHNPVVAWEQHQNLKKA